MAATSAIRRPILRISGRPTVVQPSCLWNNRPVVPEAPLAPAGNGLAPAGDGWFVLNARDAAGSRGTSARSPASRATALSAGRRQHRRPAPGQPSCMYHGENEQEDFLVLSGECLLLIEGEERALKAWDFVHCPTWAEHVFVGAGTGPASSSGSAAARAATSSTRRSSSHSATARESTPRRGSPTRRTRRSRPTPRRSSETSGCPRR